MKLSKTMLSIIILSIFGSISGCSVNNIGVADKPTAVYVSNNENNSDIAALSPELSESQELDRRVTAVILDSNKDSYASGECQGEGHIILGTDNDDKIVYALTMYGEYGFQDGNFVKVSGTGVIPVRITFDDNGNLTEYKMPSDGSYYIKSIIDMFPKKYHKFA